MSINFPNADFTPQLAGYTGQGAFRFWCQKVLPIVYDDSLSYYELLNKVVNYLNNVIADVATVEGNVAELNDSYVQLQEYVNTHMSEIVEVVNTFTAFIENYFENLDVQEEINNKLDAMARDGSLSEILRPIIALEVPDIISDWLDKHITPTTPIVDNTLTISEAAADAKTTGVNFDWLKELNAINILPYIGSFNNRTRNGITFTYNENKKSCVADGTATELAVSTMFDGYDLPSLLTNNRTLYLRVSTTNNALALSIQFFDINGTSISQTNYRSDRIIEIPENTAGVQIRLRVTAGATLNNDVITFEILSGESNNKLTEMARKAEAELKDLIARQPTVTNLLKMASPRTRNGITFSVQANSGVVTLNGTCTDFLLYAIIGRMSNMTLKKGSYVLSGSSGGSSSSYGLYLAYQTNEGPISYVYCYDNPKTFTIDRDCHYWCGIRVAGGAVLDNIVMEPMLERGVVHTEYVPPSNASPVDLIPTYPIINQNYLKMSPAIGESLARWRPIFSCSKYHTAGEIYYGIPYNANEHRYGRDVFINRTVATFLSAVENPASILYTERDLNGDPAYGSMCSSFSAWLLNRGRVQWTKDLISYCLDILGYSSPESVEIGDVLIRHTGESGHVACICGIDVDAYSGQKYVTIAEEIHPGITISRLDEAGFLRILGLYTLAKYKNTQIVDVARVAYASDIITEYGNNTWFKKGEKIWCYISNNIQIIYIKRENETDYQPVNIGSLDMRDVTVDDVTNVMYDISPYLDTVGKYHVTTDVESNVTCDLLIIDCGQFEFDSTRMVVHVSDYSVTPNWCYINVEDGEAWREIRQNGPNVLEGDPVFEVVKSGDGYDIDVSILRLTPNSYSVFRINMFYNTEYGQPVQLSQEFTFR